MLKQWPNTKKKAVADRNALTANRDLRELSKNPSFHRTIRILRKDPACLSSLARVVGLIDIGWLRAVANSNWTPGFPLPRPESQLPETWLSDCRVVRTQKKTTLHRIAEAAEWPKGSPMLRCYRRAYHGPFGHRWLALKFRITPYTTPAEVQAYASDAAKWILDLIPQEFRRYYKRSPSHKEQAFEWLKTMDENQTAGSKQRLLKKLFKDNGLDLTIDAIKKYEREFRKPASK